MRERKSTISRFFVALISISAMISTLVLPIPGGIPPYTPPANVSVDFSAPSIDRVQQSMSRLPVYFEENQGQFNDKVRYYARGTGGLDLFLTATDAVYVLTGRETDSEGPDFRIDKFNDPVRDPESETKGTKAVAVYMTLVGANPEAVSSGTQQLEHRTNYFKGEESNWRTDFPNYGQVRMSGVYEGIDTVWHGLEGGGVQYDFVVEPNADPDQIRWQVAGAKSVELDEEGNLLIKTEYGEIKQNKPFSYQETNGFREEVESRFVIEQMEVRFELGEFDRSQTLTIDPTVNLSSLGFSTFLGGALDEGGYAIGVDGAGNVYVTGLTGSTSFPTTTGTFDTTHNGNFDEFVTKRNATGSALLYSTFIGGGTPTPTPTPAPIGPAVLGVYPATSVELSGNTTVIPSAPPMNVTSATASAGTSFNGRIEVDPLSGVIRITDANPASTLQPGGVFTVTVTAAGPGGTTQTTFALTVTTPATCNPVSFAATANFTIGGQTQPFSVAVGDFNRDGIQDLAVAVYNWDNNPDNVSILLGNGSGGFGVATSFGAGPGPFFVAVGDFNGDGIQDLAVANGDSNNISILLGNGSGGFGGATNFDVGNGPRSVAVGDFNGDGIQDLAAANDDSNNVSILLGNGSGGFGVPTNFGAGTGPFSVAVGDFNRDGIQDLAVANGDSNDVSILLGNGSGGFGAATNFGVGGTTPVSIAVGDFNRDGLQDLAVAKLNCCDNVSILLGNGSGGFGTSTNFGVGSRSFSIAVGDFNGDGIQDLAVALVFSNEVSILLGNGSGGFWAATNFWLGFGVFRPHSIAVGDFNGDGKQDLVTANSDVGSGLNNVSVLLSNCAPTPTQNAPFDFDGDGKTDLSIFRPSVGQWWLSRSADGVIAHTFGNSSDTIVPGDYTGDGKADVAIFRPSESAWYVLRSEDSSFYSFPFGANGDIPVPGDYDSDGKSDAAVFRPSTATWYIQRSSGGTTIQTFGASTDRPVPADYDGDGKADIAIYRPSLGQWWLNRSTAGLIVHTFGTSMDRNVPGDYTGDGKADIAIWRQSTGEWFVLRSEDSSFYSFPFGISTDIPVPGDYDGDGRTDAGVFRPSNGTWYLNRSTSGLLIQGFGLAADIPVPTAFVR